MRSAVLLLVLALQCLAPALALDTPRASKPRVERVALGQPVLAPLAHTRFCLRYPEDCSAAGVVADDAIVTLTNERRAELEFVNRTVNRALKPDRPHEPVTGENWLISPATADCNDYAVTKRHELLARGWPSSALLLAEVVTPIGEHHLVLIVRTDMGDLVADNLNMAILRWEFTRYHWVRAQSPENPQFWLTVLVDGRPAR